MCPLSENAFLIAQTGTHQLDFWTYGAFSPEHHQLLSDHHDYLRTVKPVRCGQGFDSYSDGKMFAHGTRIPMGGHPGDSYAMYQGMEADTVEGINSLFDHAEVNSN